MAGDERTGRDDVRTVVDRIYREESRRVLATLIRLIGDFELAEEALHEAFAAALAQWPAEGIPASPRPWLVSAGRFKAIDALRRRSRYDVSGERVIERLEAQAQEAEPEPDGNEIGDDRLRLIFTCCHPALSPEARVALTLRTVCDLTTEEIARAFLSTTPTIAQRIVRGKNKIRSAGIPYEVPALSELPGRLESVLQVVYLVFNEGYAASGGEALTRSDLSTEAIRLGRLLADLLPDSEVFGLLSLMLLQESRRAARTDAAGDIVLLEDQDRRLWNRGQIEEGIAQLDRALGSRRIGPYTLQAAIAAMHARAPDTASTDWAGICGLYDVLARIMPSPVVALNRAVAVAMRDGWEAGLSLVDELLQGGELDDYHLAHAARADFCRRLGRTEEARTAYRRALALARQEPERRYLEKRLAQCS
jgi:RNA polymerase sigma-70 factor, ECF subfamily